MHTVLVTVTVGLSARWLMSGPEGNPSVTILRVLSLLVIHEISIAIALLNSITLVLATYLNNILYFFYVNTFAASYLNTHGP
jgi:hypothetical protein